MNLQSDTFSSKMANNMGSLKAQAFAIKVSESVRKGKKKTYGEIAKEVGYSAKSALKPYRIRNSKAYKAAFIAENAPIIEGLQQEINRIKRAMSQKDLSQEDYRVLVGSLDLLTKNYQLLSGGATERQVFVLPSEVIKKNDLPTNDIKQLPENGSTEPHNTNV